MRGQHKLLLLEGFSPPKDAQGELLSKQAPHSSLSRKLIEKYLMAQVCPGVGAIFGQASGLIAYASLSLRGRRLYCLYHHHLSSCLAFTLPVLGNISKLSLLRRIQLLVLAQMSPQW